MPHASIVKLMCALHDCGAIGRAGHQHTTRQLRRPYGSTYLTLCLFALRTAVDNTALPTIGSRQEGIPQR